MSDLLAVGDMSFAAYGYLAGYALLGVEKAQDGYTSFLFPREDVARMEAEYRNPRTEVPIQGYLNAVRYLRTLRHETPAGTQRIFANETGR